MTTHSRVNTEGETEALLLSVGGGKGGVGKSMICSNLAVQYARAGCRVVIIDLDIGAANLHTIYGVRQPPTTIADFLTTPRSRLSDYLVDTDVPNLRLVCGSGYVPELASLRYTQKSKLIKQVRSLDADIVLLDLGAGTSNHTVDFFALTQGGVVVTTPEPTAVVNAYEFLKSVVHRLLYRMFRGHHELMELLQQSSKSTNPYSGGSIPRLIERLEQTNPWAAEQVKEVCQSLDFYLIFNQARKTGEIQLGRRLYEICHRYLNLQLNIAGMVFHNEEVSSAVVQMQPFSIAYPDSVTTKTLQRIASIVLKGVTDRLSGTETSHNFDRQLSTVEAHARQDFRLNLLTQNRLLRQRDRRELDSSAILKT